jgi:alpha-glucosidase
VDGSSFGFGPAGAHLPQPAWFGSHSVQVQEADPSSTLSLYRQALAVRRQLQTAETLEWLEGGSESVLHFARSGGWQSVTNFGTEPVPLPVGTVVIASGPLDGDKLPADTTAWIV